MSLITLVYVSFAEHTMTDSELRELLEESRQNNARLNITGMLLYRDGFFIQALEGEAEVVDELYANIAKDPRHTHVVTVYRNKITERSFGTWSMGFNILRDDALTEEQRDYFTDFLHDKKDMSRFVKNPGYASALLESFKERSYF